MKHSFPLPLRLTYNFLQGGGGRNGENRTLRSKVCTLPAAMHTYQISRQTNAPPPPSRTLSRKLKNFVATVVVRQQSSTTHPSLHEKLVFKRHECLKQAESLQGGISTLPTQTVGITLLTFDHSSPNTNTS